MPDPDFRMSWVDFNREPECQPDPAFPEGKHVDVRENKKARACTIELPYPAPRCGMHIVVCNKCGQSVAITTAGRPDDPRELTVACKMN